MSALTGFIAFALSLWPVAVALIVLVVISAQAAALREQGKALRIARSNASHARAELNRIRGGSAR